MTVPVRAIAALLLIAAPLPALAAARDCATIRAITNADGRDFADLRIAFGPGAGVLLGVGGARPDLPAAAACDVSAENVTKDLSCRWTFVNEATAAAFFDPLLARMQRCLPDGLPPAEIATQIPGWRLIRNHETLVAAPYSQTKVTLALVDARREGGIAMSMGDYLVALTVEFEQGD